MFYNRIMFVRVVVPSLPLLYEVVVIGGWQEAALGQYGACSGRGGS
jgi:hypothetical protein